MIKILKVESLTYRPGWDVTIQKVSTDEKKTENMTFYWPGKERPDEKILAGKFAYFQQQFDEPEPVPEKVYTQFEIDAVLKEKKYFTNGQHFPGDLPTKTVGGK